MVFWPYCADQGILYSWYRTETGLQLRLMSGVFDINSFLMMLPHMSFHCKLPVVAVLCQEYEKGLFFSCPKQGWKLS